MELSKASFKPKTEEIEEEEEEEEAFQKQNGQHFENEKFPSKSQEDEETLKSRLQEVNKRWEESYLESEDVVRTRKSTNDADKRAELDSEGSCNCDRIVRFSSPDLWTSYPEPSDLSDDLRAARTSDLARREGGQGKDGGHSQANPGVGSQKEDL